MKNKQWIVQTVEYSSLEDYLNSLYTDGFFIVHVIPWLGAFIVIATHANPKWEKQGAKAA